MAALMEGFSLAKIAGESSLIGVESGEQLNQVIITSKTGFINVYQLSDQKLINSWSLRHGVQITCPTVWCKSKEKFLAVQNKKQLKLWTSETTNFDKAKKKHIRSDVHRVLVQEDFPPILVCENGQVDFQENLQEGSATKPAGEGDTKVEGVLWCQSFLTVGSLTVVVLTTSKDKKITLWRHTYLSDAECWRQQRSELTRSADTMLGCCLSKKSEPTLLTLWRPGVLLETSLSSTPREVDGQEVATIPHVQRKCSIISLDHTHVAIAGIERDGKSGLGIYNVKFEAMQTWSPFPESVFTNPNLYCHYEHLLLACNKTLYAFPFHCQPSTVATLLGQQVKGREGVADTPPGSISWGEGSTTQKSNNDTEIEQLFSSLIDKKKKLSTAEFTRVFEKLMKLLQLPKNGHWLSSHQVSLLTRSCLSCSDPWPRDHVSQLIEHRLVSHSEQSGMFEALITHQEVSLLHRVITTLPDISELSLVKTVQCYLDLPDEEFVQACSDVSISQSTPETQDDQPLPICPAKAALLNHVLGLPFNDVFLVDCVRKLSFKNVLILMEYLYHLLKLLPVTCTGDANTPSLGKVTDWLMLLIDAHVTQLIVSPDARMLLGNLHEIISEQVEFYNQLSTLEAVLTQLKRKCSPVTQQKVGTYCIEVLHVR